MCSFAKWQNENVALLNEKHNLSYNLFLSICILEQDEKKFFELELVNRESNYNKVFNTAPKIGVINPMNVKTKVRPCFKDNVDIRFHR